MRAVWLKSACLSLLILLACSPSERRHKFLAKKRFRVALIPMAINQTYWLQCKQGAFQAAKELGAEVYWDGPDLDNDPEVQQQVFLRFIKEGIDAVVIAPIDGKLTESAFSIAVSKKIPVICIDSKSNLKKAEAFVGTDNLNAGAICGKKMLEVLKGKKGLVAVFQLANPVKSTLEREEGFWAQAQGNDVSRLEHTFAAQNTVSQSVVEARNLLKNHPNLGGVFAVNEISSLAMLTALRDSSIHTKAKLIGFDAHPRLLQALKAGELEALAVQKPYDMGYKAVQKAYLAYQGRYVESEDTGIELLTKSDFKHKEN